MTAASIMTAASSIFPSSNEASLRRAANLEGEMLQEVERLLADL
jgi:hypothetical protein